MKPISIFTAICLLILSGIRIGRWIDKAIYPLPWAGRVAPAAEVNIVFLMISLAVAILFFCYYREKPGRKMKRHFNKNKGFWYWK